MMGMLWVVLLVALTGSQLGSASPVRSAPQSYPHEPNGPTEYEGWAAESGLYAAIPVLALVLTAVGLLFGCTWCYRHKDCKPNAGDDNQIFTASAAHLHDGRRSHPPDSGFSEPANNNISEDNNNGPISLREMQNIANNNAATYIVSENEERNRVSRESVVEFEPLPSGVRVQDPLEHCADWFGGEDFPRPRLQYLREIGRGWFGRVVEGEIEEAHGSSTVAVKILNPNATLEEKARFLDESRIYRDASHENVLAFVAKCLQEDPWILIFELCSMDLQQYLVVNRPKMAILNESGVPLRLMCDVTSALAYLHSRGYLHGNVWCGSVLVRGAAESARAVLGRYADSEPDYRYSAPETRTQPPLYSASSEVWAAGSLVWAVCAWGAAPERLPPAAPSLPCPYCDHLYQVMQLCWNPSPSERPTAAQMHALLEHLLVTHRDSAEPARDSTDFELRWQRLKPNTIAKLDEHVAIVHAPSTSTASHFTESDTEFDTAHTIQDSLSVDMDTAVSRSSSIMSDKDALSVQIKSESLTNLHGSLEDVRNIYLTHNETAALECHQGNMSLEEAREREQDRSDGSVDPWLKDIIAGSQDDVSYYRDVSDVIKNLDNILNSEKTSSSESSHQASPSRDNLSLDCKKDYPMQSSMVKSPGITNFQNILDAGFSETRNDEAEPGDNDADRDTIGTLSHSFERHSEDTTSQHTLENLTPETPIKDLDIIQKVENEQDHEDNENVESVHRNIELPNETRIVSSNNEIPMPKESCVSPILSVSDIVIEQLNVKKDCQTSCDSKLNELRTDIKNETKSIGDIEELENVTLHHELGRKISTIPQVEDQTRIKDAFPKSLAKVAEKVEDNNKSLGDLNDVVHEVKLLEQDFLSSVTNENPLVDVKETVNSDLLELVGSVIKTAPENTILDITANFLHEERSIDVNIPPTPKQTPESVQNNDIVQQFSQNTNYVNEQEETELVTPIQKETEKLPTPVLPPEIVQNIVNSELPVELNLNDDFDFFAMHASPVSNETDTDYIVNQEPLKKECNTSEKESIVKNIIEDVDIVNETDFHRLNLSSSLGTQDKPIADHAKDMTVYDVISKIKNGENAPDLINTQSKIVRETETIAAVNLDRITTKEVELEDIKINDNDINMKCNVFESTSGQKRPVEEMTETCIENKIFVPKNDNISQEFIETIQATIHSSTESAPVKVICNIPSVKENFILPEIENNVNLSNSTTYDCKDSCISTDTDKIAHKEHTTDTKATAEVMRISVDEQLQISLEEYVAVDKLNEDTSSIDVQVFKLDSSLPAECDNKNEHENIAGIQSQEVTTSVADEAANEALINVTQQSDNSTVYMDFTNNSRNKLLIDNTLDTHVKDVIKSCLDSSTSTDNYCSLPKNESTEYLDLPSFGTKEVDNFLQMERAFNSYNIEVASSTPLSSDNSTDVNNTLENSAQKADTHFLSETKVPDYGSGLSLTKLEQRCAADSMSPFESPTKSHHTDTYDENSSVVLGPFENCALELFKGVKSIEPVDIPREELLAFSSNFSEINLETPSPLRDGNFLNEVPDIAHDDLQFDNIQSVSEKQSDPQTDTDSDKSATEKHISPSTPPNSPGIFLATTSQEKYLVDMDLNHEPTRPEPDLSLQNEIELNQIELQITSKLAMAENENNMNIEYSGPLTVEGLVSEEGDNMLRESDALPESYLAGNGGSVEDLRENLTLDEECVKALRNELELKLPLAQVAAIEPPCENEWPTELPPPPELVVNYPGALSPIAEETGQQLSAYENDINWNTSTRTDSSESYPEPCNNSMDEVTELPTGANSGLQDQSTYTVPSREHSQNNTYTVQKDIMSSREITMSADSLNASSHKIPTPDVDSPIDDKTYTKQDDDKVSNCERISQVSPFLLSPTTDTSAPDTSDNLDNATGVSTLSKTTLPSDAKLSKPSETQCLSKPTSIDSWCSNDTLYNVEENFDDLAMDADLPDFRPDKEEGNSASTDTLTHNEDEKEASHCSTYIIHASKSEPCETFSPDSITANDNHTYTKVKTEAGTTPSATKSDLNESTKNSQTKDLAYGTLMSGIPSYSNCTTDIISGFDDWKLPQPEMVRKSPMADDVNMTPPRLPDDKETENSSPQLDTEPCLKKMDSVELSCLHDNLLDSHNKTDTAESHGILVQIDSPNSNYKNMAPSVTSTPINDPTEDANNGEAIPMILPEINTDTSDNSVNVPNFQTFLQSAEIRPQDLSSNITNVEFGNQESEVLLEGDSNPSSKNSNKDSLAISERTPTYSDFENSAVTKPQDSALSKEKSNQSMESGISSEDFTKFENSIKFCPQDLSSLIDASSLLLKSERLSSELAMSSVSVDQSLTSQSTSRVNEQQSQSILNPPIITNLTESHNLVNFRESSSTFLINFDADDETEQPHSIIITETTIDTYKHSPSKSYDSHETKDQNYTYDSHTNAFHSNDCFEKSLEHIVNGEFRVHDVANSEEYQSFKAESEESNLGKSSTKDKFTPNGSQPQDESIESEDIQCNGSEKFATVSFLHESFEELIESNVDDGDSKDVKNTENEPESSYATEENAPESMKSIDSATLEALCSPKEVKSIEDELREAGELTNGEQNGKLVTVTDDFLRNEKKFCQLDFYLPLLSDIRFTGPATEIMSTSFTQDSPTSPTSPECEQDNKPDTAADILKEWDSDSDSHSSNSSSGEFIWKGGDGHETSVVPSTHFDHQRSGGSQGGAGGGEGASESGAPSSRSGDSGSGSGSGSEGDEVEFVPSSWDCRAEPSKSSLRSLEQATPDNKKRVVFKRQKYHCVYEYPREVADVEPNSPAAYLPDLSTYCDWDPSSAEEAELGYGQLFGAPSPLDMYPLRAGIAFGADYDEDFFISSSARPFESLGIMSTTSQFFPGKHIKPSLLQRELADEVPDEFPPPPSPLPHTTLATTRTPSLDFTTPDSGVEDITPGFTTDEDFKKKIPEGELTWRTIDSCSSSESVSPSSPGGEALGGLRHTRDKLKLDLPPSPHVPSPRHNRVFNFVLDKPKRREDRPEGSTPLVMSDETPVVTTSLPLQKDEDIPVLEPTFSTFGKSVPKIEAEQKIILDEVDQADSDEVKVESPKVVEPVKGEGTVLDSGDEDSGIESSSKATLERNKTSNVS